MAKMKRITAALFLALFMCFSFSSIFTVSADELSSDDWDQISLDLQGGDQQSGEDFGFIKNNNGGFDDGEWILYLGIGLIVVGMCGIVFAVLSSKRQRALARKRRAEYIKRMNSQQKRVPPDAQRRSVNMRNPQQRRPVQTQQQSRNIASQSPRTYNQPRRQQYDYIKGSSRYVDGGSRYQPSQKNIPADMYSESNGEYIDRNYNGNYNADYEDGYRVSRRTTREPLNNSSNINSGRPVQGQPNDQYEDISSFSSADKNIYSSSTRKNNNKYINDYIDY